MAVLKDLIVHGRSHFINGAQFNTINAESIGADTGIFNKLVATTLDATTASIDDLTAKNATVTALLDVQGDMQTNSWSNSNIATIDGSFYITPTSVSVDGSDVDASSYSPTGYIVYNSSNTNFTKISVTGTFDTSQLTLNNATHVPWPANSEVIITGDVLVGNEWLPLGTIRGKLAHQVAASNASKEISIIPLSATLSDGHGNKPVALEAIRSGLNLTNGTSATLKMRKIKVSLTSRSDGTDQYPVGILLTAQGTGTGQTFIDIYGGGEKRNGQSGTINGSTKYFTKPTVRLGNLEGLPPLAGQTPSGWGIYTSNGFFEGAIVAKEGYIGNTGSYWTIGGGTSAGATYMYSGPSTVSATSTAGTYLGTNGFLNTASSTTYAQITNGVLTAQGAVIKGALTATSLATGTKTGSTSGNGVFIDSSGNIYAGNGSTNKFTVTSAGVLTATDAKLNNLTLYDSNGYKRAAVTTSGFIIYDGASATTTTQLSSFTASSGNATIKLGQEAANKFNILITDSAVSSKGPGILLRQGTNVLNEITADGMKLYLASDTTNSIAEFGDNIRIGATSTGHAALNEDGMDVYIGEDLVAHYGDYARIGKDGEANTRISPSEVVISAGNNIDALRITPDGNTQKARFTIYVNRKILAGASLTYTHPSAADSNTNIVYTLTPEGSSSSKMITVTKGQTTATTTVTSPFSFEYSATTSAITIKNNESSTPIILLVVSYTKTATVPLIKGGGVLALGASPRATDFGTVFAVGNGTASFNAFTVFDTGLVTIHGGVGSVGSITLDGRTGYVDALSYSLSGTEIADHVVEQGTSGIWTYRKWSSGKSECWGSVSTSTSYAVWVSPIYYGSTYCAQQTFPSGLFVAAPLEYVTIYSNGGDTWTGHDQTSPVSSTKTGRYYPVRAGNLTGTTSYITQFYDVGRWK